ncbi:RanGTP-binding protein-domain-containing protein [Coemansia spiralis]|nr:RanGTP-binding protein-domain-containing protein [Coemansia spiralis]
MDELFSNLAIQTVQLVGKAAFGAAGTLALKRMSEYANRVPQPKEKQSEVERLRIQFEAKLRIITPAIDLIDIISARGHSTMASVLQLTYSLRNDIVAFSAKLEKLDQMVAALDESQKSNTSLASLFRRVHISQASRQEGSSARLVDLNESIVSDLRQILANIENAVPLLNLALTTSGAHLGSSLPPGISPSRLMQASTLLSRSASWFEISSRKPNESSHDTLVGDLFALRLYSLFVGSVRPRSKHDFTWKEEFAKCQAALWRCAEPEPVDERIPMSEYFYELRIIEDLNDGRYHDDQDGADSQQLPAWVSAISGKLGDRDVKPGRTICIPLDCINSLHYTSAGSLLNIEESSSPVLVVSSHQNNSHRSSVDVGYAKQEFPAAAGADSEDSSDAKVRQHMLWYALEVSMDGPPSSVGSGSDSECENESESESDRESCDEVAGTGKKSNSESGNESSSGDEEGEDGSSGSSGRDNSGSDGDVGGDEQSEKDAEAQQEDQLSAKDNASKEELSSDDQDDEQANKENIENRSDVSVNDLYFGSPELLASDEYLRPIEFLANEWSQCTLSLLEYTVRLASVEMREQLSHLEVTDEKLRLYLLSGAPGDPYAAQHAPGAQPLQSTQYKHAPGTTTVASRIGTGVNTIAATPSRHGRGYGLRLPSALVSSTPRQQRSKSNSRSTPLFGGLHGADGSQ